MRIPVTTLRHRIRSGLAGSAFFGVFALIIAAIALRCLLEVAEQHAMPDCKSPGLQSHWLCPLHSPAPVPAGREDALDDATALTPAFVN